MILHSRDGFWPALEKSIAARLRFACATVPWCLFVAFSSAVCIGQAPPTRPGAEHAQPSPAAVPAPAATRKCVVYPDHENGIYGPNEPVTWNVEVTGDRAGLTVAFYVVKKDGAATVASGTIDLTGGRATVSASRPDPGILLVQIYAGRRASGAPLAIGGAVISPDKIDLSTPMAGDFDAFWQARLAELAEVPANPSLEQVDIGAHKFSEAVDFYKVRLDNVHGTHVYGQLARPKEGKRFPAMLMLQYAGVYPLEKDQVIAQSKSGWLVLNISAHDLPIDEPAEFYNQLKDTTLKDYQLFGADDPQKTYFLRMVLGCVRAVQYLAARPDWDGRTLLVTGTSQGGYQSFASAALCPQQVSAVSTSVPAGCDLLALLGNPARASGWPSWISSASVESGDANRFKATAGYYDAIDFAAHVRCPSLVSVGLIDETARPTGVIAAFNAIRGPKKLMILPLCNHRGDGGAEAPYYQEFNVWKNDLRDGHPLPLESGVRGSTSAIPGG